MRSKIVAGNWKMNKNLEETETLLSALSAKLPDTGAEVMVAPTFVNLTTAVRQLESSAIKVIAQNMHFAENGAYTGEISANMLLNIGVDTVIIGIQNAGRISLKLTKYWQPKQSLPLKKTCVLFFALEKN